MSGGYHVQSIRERAMNYLARREHSVKELRQKLSKAGFEVDEIETTIARLTEQDLQSDQRFAESYTHHRSKRGFGSQWIVNELKQRGVDGELINNLFKQLEIDWFELAASVRTKRFGEDSPTEIKERVKQQRFLYYRGFTQEQITASFNL